MPDGIEPGIAQFAGGIEAGLAVSALDDVDRRGARADEAGAAPENGGQRVARRGDLQGHGKAAFAKALGKRH